MARPARTDRSSPDGGISATNRSRTEHTPPESTRRVQSPCSAKYRKTPSSDSSREMDAEDSCFKGPSLVVARFGEVFFFFEFSPGCFECNTSPRLRHSASLRDFRVRATMQPRAFIGLRRLGWTRQLGPDRKSSGRLGANETFRR